ncbi:MAG: protein-lysine N-methyltransferase [Flavipsychrobacter sp.]|nr:protein-lysine N-methyltransferase [Flavipsychrobacter sp.]
MATAFIPKGTITWIGDPLDQVFTPREVKEMHPVFRDIIDTYAFRDNKGDFVLCWDHSRFVNHSFNSNCLSTAYNFELAVRDIYPGEELTNDYGYLNLTEPFVCLPEPGTNRTKVMPDDLVHYHMEWDVQLIEAFKSFNTVSQPLAKFIESQYRNKVELVAAGRGDMDSILNCYYDERKRRMAA